MDIQEFAAVEHIEITGSYRIVSLEMVRTEEVVLETPRTINTPADLTDDEINALVEHGIVPTRNKE